ncbi:LPS export ABC transporter permease LptF [Variovorax paradoxus]|uniref:LPS export ABC transporter permease LptF n=1 Tax=Variovorax paradoxus TaxID=34073 RepID=UPI0024800B94|nr:LPS export ABC transporter permease LptF [Variovorax paradoxus]WGT65917.1 LPS export ABC transporter permease LptF [Variovorax paradoxus]
MLFHSSLRKELSRSFGATLVVLVTIVMTMMLIRTLGLASKGSVNPSEVFLVMAYTVLGYMPTILSLSLFIAIVGTLSRMYRDSEMVIWFSSGRGLVDFLQPLFRFAWPVLALIAIMALLGWPWANSQTIGMRAQYERRSDIERVTPGEFRESAGRIRVFFIDKDTPDGATATNVFIWAIERGLQITTSARSGRIENVGEHRYLMLSNGQRVERPLVQTATSGLKISEFETYGTRAGGNDSFTADTTPARAKPTIQLLREPGDANRGELAWRIGMLLAAINFVLLALTVSSVNPRVGRSGNLLLALFAFVVYYNMLNLGQSWISSGRYGMGSFMLLLHGGVLLIGVAWLALRNNNWGRRRKTERVIAGGLPSQPTKIDPTS